MRLLPATMLVLLCSTIHAEIIVTPDKPDGVYQVGETIRWHIQCKDQTAASEAGFLLKAGAFTEVKNGSLTFNAGAADVEAKLDAPGTLLLEVHAKSADGKEQTALGGAVAAPQKIAPSAPPPADFAAFWEAKLAELAAVPANPHLEAGTAGRAEIDYWKVTLDNIRGTHVQAQLGRPKGDGKYPAILIFQGAGIYPLPKAMVVPRAKEGWLVMNVNAHDLPLDQPAAFYKDQANGPLKDYPSIGNDDRETAYFLRMYLACYRAAQYLAERPDWDGKTLVAMGTSQGGMQALVTAALHPKVSAAIVCMPAGCDMLGPTIGRKGGWPSWYGKTEGKDADKVHQACRYYDVVNFAPRIKCPVLAAMGLIDEVCPAAGILAATNQMPGPRELVIMPLTGHVGTGSNAAYTERSTAWLAALRQGQPAPARP